MHAEASFYTLKELESLGKSKGVIPQAVKEVVESLCADGAIINDKVGSQSIFWALPSQELVSIATKKQRVLEEQEKYQKDLARFEAELAELTSQPAAESEVDEARLAAQRKECATLRSEVATMERCGPEKLAELEKATLMALGAANRWADNIESLRSLFLRERREVKADQFNQMFELPEEFEYLE
uniref:Meiotic nuclear division protein 1 homolog n=1 Tax=Noctiluca scintillans TaxID=2966 RepID=A0A7S0ZPB8_NOCSC